MKPISLLPNISFGADSKIHPSIPKPIHFHNHWKRKEQLKRNFSTIEIYKRVTTCQLLITWLSQHLHQQKNINLPRTKKECSIMAYDHPLRNKRTNNVFWDQIKASIIPHQATKQRDQQNRPNKKHKSICMPQKAKTNKHKNTIAISTAPHFLLPDQHVQK